MRTACLLILLLLFTDLTVKAQKRKTYKINPGEKVSEVISNGDKYTYPEFQPGNAYFTNNTYTPSRFNYNALLGEMQFIDGKDDTLSIGDDLTIRLLVVGGDSFYYNKGFIRQLQNFGNFRLGVHQFFSFVNKQKIGGMGEVSSASIDTYASMASTGNSNSIANSSYFKDLVAREILTIAKNTVYYIGDRFNNFKPLTKKSVQALFANHENAVQTYLKEKGVDFGDEASVKAMLHYLNSLEQ